MALVYYKQDKENKVADGLSMKGEEHNATLALISFLTPLWIDELRSSFSLSQEILDVIFKL